MDGRLESLDLRSKVAMGAIVATALFFVIVSMLNIATAAGVMDALGEGPMMVFGLVLMMSGFGLLGCLFIAVVAWSMWVHRAYSNLPEMFGIPIDHTPGWAPGSFFIPFVNIFLPYKITQEIWDKIAPTEMVGQRGWLVFWWACWIGSGVLSRVTGNEELLMSMGVGVFAGVTMLESAVYVGAAFGAVQVARHITKFQIDYMGGGGSHVADFFR